MRKNLKFVLDITNEFPNKSKWVIDWESHGRWGLKHFSIILEHTGNFQTYQEISQINQENFQSNSGL